VEPAKVKCGVWKNWVSPVKTGFQVETPYLRFKNLFFGNVFEKMLKNIKNAPLYIKKFRKIPAFWKSPPPLNFLSALLRGVDLPHVWFHAISLAVFAHDKPQ